MFRRSLRPEQQMKNKVLAFLDDENDMKVVEICKWLNDCKSTSIQFDLSLDAKDLKALLKGVGGKLLSVACLSLKYDIDFDDCKEIKYEDERDAHHRAMQMRASE